MKKVSAIISTLFLFPFIASAQGVQGFLINLVTFFNSVVIRFLFGVAFLFFIINAVRYFVIGASNEEGREKAKSLAIYGVAAFVFIIIFWGIVNLLSSSLGLEGCTTPGSDYYLNHFVGPSLPNCP